MTRQARKAIAVAILAGAALAVTAGADRLAQPRRGCGEGGRRAVVQAARRRRDVVPGPLAGFGPSLDASARAAVTEINAALRRVGMASRMSVEFVGTEDDQGQVHPAVEGGTKLVQINRANVWWGRS